VSGYWFQSDDGRKGTTFMLFEREDAARSTIATAPRPPDGAGVAITRFEAMRIVAQA
jgi:hypothetical protein